MKIKTKLKDVFVIKHKTFKDKRGYFKEIIRENKINKKFPFLVMSCSKKKCDKRIAYSKKKISGKIRYSNQR